MVYADFKTPTKPFFFPFLLKPKSVPPKICLAHSFGKSSQMLHLTYARPKLILELLVYRRFLTARLNHSLNGLLAEVEN